MSEMRFSFARYTPEALALIKEVLRVDAETGHLFWRVTRSNRKVKVGARAGAKSGTHRRVMVDLVSYGEHMVVWALVHGEWPSKILDHINRDGMDNRPCNLREATFSQNRANSKKQPGVTPYVGVSPTKAGRWQATLKLRHLGTFDTALEAALVYDIAARKAYGEFHRSDLEAKGIIK